jgi:hypothetical protein
MSRSHRPPVGPRLDVVEEGSRVGVHPEQPPVNVFPDPNVFWVADSSRIFVRAGYPDSGRRCPLPPLH